jgi:exosortase H (IPTLxxWG-CTERM-specific)
MGLTKEKKARIEIQKKKLRQNKNIVIFSKFNEKWLQKRPILFFILIFAALIILFYLLWITPFFETHFQPHIVSVNVVISNFVLNIFGQKTQANGSMIYSSLFSIDIKRGCDGVEAMALFASVLLAFPAQWKKKLIGLAGGVSILFSLNIVRIVSLFLTGIYYHKAFDIMHVQVWQVLFIFVALGLWIFWIQKFSKHGKLAKK